MSGFSSEEVQAQVERFLTTQVASTKNKLELRDTLAMRDAVYDMLSTSLLLRPDSYFYLVWLASNRLENLRAQQAEDVETIQELSGFLDFRTQRIGSTAELVNAQAAVLELNAGLNARRTGQGIQGAIGPAVDRFQRSTDRFIRAELEPNVVRSGTVTETPEEIRAVIRDRLQQVLERHEEISSLVEAIAEAVVRLSATSLPESTVRDIVGRMQDRLEALQETLEGDTALSESRESMLELLVMRTLLVKASSFREPRLVLVPLAGDNSTASLDSGLEPGGITGSANGPFNYDALVTNLLRVQVGTPFTQVDVTLPGGSNAQVQSAPLTFPGFTFTVGADITVSLDGGSPSTVTAPAGAYASSAALAAALDPLIAGWTVLGSGSRVVFYSDTFGDGSEIIFSAPTGASAQFFVDLPLEEISNKGRGPSTEELLDVIGGATTQFSAEEELVDYGSFSGSVGSGTPTTIDVVLASGADLDTTNGSTVVSSPSLNFSLLGVEAGMGISITAPFALDAVVVSVDGGTLTLDQAATATATATYEVGTDFRGVPDGARVDLGGQDDQRNTGLYRVAVSGGKIAHLVLNRALLATPEIVAGSIFTSFLRVVAPSAGPLDGIATFPADVGLTALGFTASATQAKGQANTARVATGVDFLARGVRIGDLLKMVFSTTPLADQLVESVSTDTLVFGPGATYPGGSVTYAVHSARYTAWEALRVAMQAWLDDDTASDVTAFEFQVGRLVGGANPSGQITGVIDAYASGLEDLRLASASYVVPEERTILNVLRTLDEQGMDRARDLLVTLDLEEFFTMSKDSVSYSTHLIRTTASVTREIAPVGKSYKSKIPGEQNVILSNREEPFDLNQPEGVDQ
jgi:hypothetical protein